MKFLSYCVLISVSSFAYHDTFGSMFRSIINVSKPIFQVEDKSLEHISEELLSYMKVGNAKGIAKYFSANLTMSIVGENGVYTKYQSEILLNTFFSRHKPKVVKLTQVSDAKNGYQYFTFSLAAEQVNYRVFIKIGAGSNNQLIEEFRIDKS